MTRIIHTGVFLLGALAILWTGSDFVGKNVLALIVTLIIGVVYLLGFVEMLQFRQATATLSSALSSMPTTVEHLEQWLKPLHPSLHNAVRLRIEGERTPLPGPVFTPYLVGLLVMLGLLGTFVGMVVTLNGAVLALEGTTELSAIRAGLAAPIKGLGLAFGTSVAGVTASAMLGLMATLCRRERMQATGVLDSKIATVLRGFSLVHNRNETFKALQYQAQALPDMVNKLQEMSTQMERMSQHLGHTLISNQENFHQTTKVVYAELAASVEHSLKESLSQSGRLAGENLKPIMETAMAGISQSAQQTQQQLSRVAQEQLHAFAERFDQTAADVAQAWRDGMGEYERAQQQRMADHAQHDTQRLSAWVEQFESLSSGLMSEWRTTGDHALSQQQAVCAQLESSAKIIVDHSHANAQQLLQTLNGLLTSSEALVRSRMDAEQTWLAAHSERIEQLTLTIRAELNGLRADEEQRGNAAVDRLSALESAVVSHLSTLGAALEQPMIRLIETASETPKAAAEVIQQLRGEIANNLARENDLLAERTRIMDTLNGLMRALEKTSTEQQQAIEALVNSSASMLQHVGAQFIQQVESETSKLTETAAQVTGSSTEVSSLSEAFGFAVELFSESNDKLISNLNRIEESLEKSSTRSDEQLAYYVAQAREIIDLSMMSQKEVFEELRRLNQDDVPAVEEIG